MNNSGLLKNLPSFPRQHSSSALACEVLTSGAAVEAIAEEWKELHTRMHGTHVTAYETFYLWWKAIGKLKQILPHVVIARCYGALVAVLPLTVQNRNGLRILQSQGSFFPECDALYETPQLVEELWRTARRSPTYDFAKIKGVQPGTLCETALASFGRRRDKTHFFFLDLTGLTTESWFSSLPKKFSKSLKRRIRRLEEKSNVRYETYKSGPLPWDVVNLLLRQKQAWCRTRGKSGIFDRPGMENFICQWVEDAARRGRLFLAWLECGEEKIAYQLGLLHHGILYDYIVSYDPAWSAYAPGDVLTHYEIFWAIENQFKGIDFMYTTGSESEKYFKQKYTNRVQASHEFTFSRGLHGRAMESAFVTLRRLYRKISTGKTKESDKAHDTSVPDTENDNNLPASTI